MNRHLKSTPLHLLTVYLLAGMGTFLSNAQAQSKVEASAGQATQAVQQDLRAINQKVKEFLMTQSAGSPGKVEVSTTPIDPNLRLNFCPAPEAFFPVGSRAWGKTSVGIRCSDPSAWTIYVQANVSIYAEYIVAAAPLSQGQVLKNNDLQMQKGDLTILPAGIFTNSAQVIGKSVKMSLAAGSVIRQDMIKLQSVVQQNQTVRVLSVGQGFSISTEGQALSSATEDQAVQVRMVSGQVITGTANASGQVIVNSK